MTKTAKLTVVLGILILISLFLGFYKGGRTNGGIETSKFQVADTTAIQKITIKSDGINNVITRSDRGWLLNDQYDIDESLIKIVSNILRQVQVKRFVSKISNEDIVKELKASGQLVQIDLIDGASLTFYAGGNSAKTQAYFLAEGEQRACMVEIPGYRNYLSGIFELTTFQWRDRLLFSSNWRTIQSLKFDYSTPSKKDLSIKFDGKFLAVQGVNQIDTSAMMNYLAQYEYFQINDFLEQGKYSKYDSISQTVPLATLELQDIDRTKSRILSIYPLIQGERFHLITDEEGQMMVVDQTRLNNLLTTPSNFISE